MADDRFIEVLRTRFLGIKCDAPGCDYYDDSAEMEDYPLYLNKPCPKCGANLLTEADMKTVIIVQRKIRSLNEWLNRWVPKVVLRMFDTDPSRKMVAVTFRAKMDGSGKFGLGKAVVHDVQQP